MQATTPDSPIPVPDIDIDEPVAVIPAASVAPLDGPSDGERINTFMLAPKHRGAAALGAVREHVLDKPLASLGAAFALGWVLSRMLR